MKSLFIKFMNIGDWVNYLIPYKTMEEFDSKYNGQIKVLSEFGNIRVRVKGIPQSGGIVQDILKKGLNKMGEVNNFLLLGLGGGGILDVANKKWSGVKMTAVEIDPVMIMISRKYFHLDKLSSLDVVNMNAVSWVEKKVAEKLKGPALYDGILVDCYIGDELPGELESDKFIFNLSKLVDPQGTIVFNRISGGKDKVVSNKNFVDRLSKYFDDVDIIKAYSNILIVAKL